MNIENYKDDYEIKYRVEDNLILHFSIYEDLIDNTKELFIDGSLKWDHCMNFKFYPNDAVCIHTCSKKNVYDLADLLAHIYDLGEKNIKNWMNY